MSRIFAYVLPHHECQNLDLVHLQNDRAWSLLTLTLRARYLENKRMRRLLGEIETTLSARDAYSDFFSLGWTRPSMGELDAEIEREVLRKKALADEHRRRLITTAEARVKEQAEALVDWRNHVSRRYPQFEVTALRLSVDKAFIETSRGASVPVEVAPVLWKAANRQREIHEAYTFHTPHKVGEYRLTRIEADGTLVVGCHTIPFTELELIAEQLGWLHKEAA